MVYRIFVEKRRELALEAKSLFNDARMLLGIEKLSDVRIFNRYDVENIDPETFERSKNTVFSEPQLDIVSDTLEEALKKNESASKDENDAAGKGLSVFAVEYLPGQFDQRADSAAQCIQIISQKERPLVRSARVYALCGDLDAQDIEKIKNYVINPVEAREASLEKPETLETVYPKPSKVEIVSGFIGMKREELEAMIKKLGLAMDIDDLEFCRSYFEKENRDPSITEIRMIDTYWSDHCRHTTFGTIIDNVTFEDPEIEKAYKHYIKTREELGRKKPICLMDIATIATKYLKENGYLDKLDESEEINACTVKIEVENDGKKEPWLLLFKNETHNHPTEIEPFGGAATCIGGAIRDPLSGRAYVYGAMRVTGAADPLKPIEETIPGKLPQRKLVTTAAAGYSSYGNQIGLATGIVDELYHPGYAAKRMEIGAVIAAAPAENVRREVPAKGDIVILLGGSTGRDGIGGATGSSKAHDSHSVENCGAEVQKGNAPEERKLQRLFRNPKATRMIKRCNDFGAGGVSVAIGELADGLEIDLNAVPKKYEGLDGTELAISESQERMAVVVEAKDKDAFLALAAEENLQAVPVAKVTDTNRLIMKWNGDTIVDISRDFLNSNGAEKHISVDVAPDLCEPYGAGTVTGSKDEAREAKISSPQEFTPSGAMIETNTRERFAEKYRSIADDLNICSKRGLSERFDSTIGAGSVMMPFGGRFQLTPVQAMVQKISIEKGHTDDCSLMSWGYNPFIMTKSRYRGAYMSVIESVCKLIATGAEFKDVYLTFQEYFEKLKVDPKRWGKPLAALLGAFEAQMDLKIAAIGGKDSMSGSFEEIDVPPTLVSFAVTTQKTDDIISPEFKGTGHTVLRIAPEYADNGLPDPESLLKVFEVVNRLMRNGKVAACYTPGIGGIAEAILKMCLGNGTGFEFNPTCDMRKLFGYDYASFILEIENEDDGENITELLAAASGQEEKTELLSKLCGESKEFTEKHYEILGHTTPSGRITLGNEAVSLGELLDVYEGKLENVYNCNISARKQPMEDFIYVGKATRNLTTKGIVRPKVLIPAFPGTNCEYDSAKAVEDAGGEAKIVVIRNLTGDAIARSIEEFAEELKTSQMIFIPGGFSGGDEPDGSGKFITAFFRNDAIKEGVTDLLENRDGLMCGICNGFQALIKLGLVPYGRILDTDENCPTLTFNTIGRHQSRIVRTRIVSNKSPWLANTNTGDIYSVPISHGEGRFIAKEALIRTLAINGQIATQYVDIAGHATNDVRYNPNDSMYSIEGITSPDGRVFGKMGHSERVGSDLYRNVPGNYDIGMFKAAVQYFK
ncbi:MAG: phosphoribosylformylglycinamidine synthase [Lachnospiraceae bacterium]|nr:phosphoribosylformylglycinamidine synthase [Lachnospiraceae bacterium]